MQICYRRYMDNSILAYDKKTTRVIEIRLGHPFAYVNTLNNGDLGIKDVCKYGSVTEIEDKKFEDWWERIVHIQSLDEISNGKAPNLNEERKNLEIEIREELK